MITSGAEDWFSALLLLQGHVVDVGWYIVTKYENCIKSLGDVTVQTYSLQK
jgi:hypothetical protein